ncbi:hypothetical protein V491_04130, partial [Pseudogymnoascus sp. VKM F-3775]
MAAANLPSFAMSGDFVPGDWGFTSDQLLADNSNTPDLFALDFLDFNAAAALDDDLAFFSAPASADHVFPHAQDRPNMQSRGFEGGAWYDDFVLSSYFNGGEAETSLSSATAPVGELIAQTQVSSSSTSPSGRSDKSHSPGELESDRGLSPRSLSSEAGGSSRSPELDLFRDRNVQAAEVLDGALWDRLQSDASSPTHSSTPTHDPRTVAPRTTTPRTATPALQRQSSDVIVDDPVPWDHPQIVTATMPRNQARVTPKHILAPTSRDHPIAHAVP